MKVAIRADRVLLDRLDALHYEDRHRILRRAVALATEDLNGGTRRRLIRKTVDVEDGVGRDYERGLMQNRSLGPVAVDRALRRELGEP